LKSDCELEVIYNDRVFKVHVGVEITLSPDVSKVGSTYFEGILQLRNARQEIKEYIQNYCVKNKVFVNKITDKESEVDYYFVKKHQIQPLALKLMRNFGATIDNNPRLFSRNRQTSKDIYRLNVLVTIPSFTVGDVVDFNDMPFYVTETGKIVTGINLILGKKATFRNEEASNVKKLPKLKSKIMITHPEPQVIDPETYEAIVLRNPLGGEIVQGQNVTFVRYKGCNYLLK
jgi:NMD protein affecting ribosome stability and mRNA decay